MFIHNFYRTAKPLFKWLEQLKKKLNLMTKPCVEEESALFSKKGGRNPKGKESGTEQLSSD